MITKQDVEKLIILKSLDAQPAYEHGQWWVLDNATPQSWSVVECQLIGGEDYLDLEEL